MSEQKVLVLKAKAVVYLGKFVFKQEFVFWNGSDWVPWPHDGQDFAQVIRDGDAYEIQVQPLKLSDAGKNEIEGMVKDGDPGTSIYRYFWQKDDLKWEEDQNRRISWKFWKRASTDRRIVYTTFTEGKWDGEDGDLDFKDGAKTNDFSGTFLAGLKFATTDVEPSMGKNHLPKKLDYCACAGCEFDGIRKLTSFRGAHLHKAKFCGKSTLQECDLSSSICWRTEFSFPDLKRTAVDIDRKFLSASLKGAWVHEVEFNFRRETHSPPESKKALYEPAGCCGSEEKFYFGLRDFVCFLFFAICTSRQTLSKHKSEIVYLVDELERLRNYEVSQDNWQEIIDSWIALEKMEFDTKRAAKMKCFLFPDTSSATDASTELMSTGRVLYSIEDAPHGLLLKIKKLVGEKLLRNENYMTEKKLLTDEISNIDAILAMKDQIITLLQNFLLGLFYSRSKYRLRCMGLRHNHIFWRK